MKEIFNINDFITLDTTEIEVITEIISDYPEKQLIELVEQNGIATIDYTEFEEVYLEQLKESLSIGEQLIIELEGFIEVDAFEFKVKGYKLNQKTNKIELILE